MTDNSSKLENSRMQLNGTQQRYQSLSKSDEGNNKRTQILTGSQQCLSHGPKTNNKQKELKSMTLRKSGGSRGICEIQWINS